MRTRSALRPLPAMSIASKSPIGDAHRGAHDFIARAHDLHECLVFEAVLGERRRFLVDVDAIAFRSGRAGLDLGRQRDFTRRLSTCERVT